MAFEIGRDLVGGPKTWCIAEIGNNHNGDIDLAIELVDIAVAAGADCAKFQMRNIEEVYRKKSLDKVGEDLGTEYIIDLLGRFELSIEEQARLKEYCDGKNITYMCTPWDQKSLAVLEQFGVEAYKIASADLTNIPLIDQVSDTGKPLIISTGMSTEDEIRFTASFLQKKQSSFALLHCNSTYPAPFHDIQLGWMKNLKEFTPVFGYSGHERGTAVSLAAVALGASIIERHLTLDRTMEGPDHAASLNGDEFKALVTGIREIEEALRGDANRSVSQGEMINRENLAKSLVAARPLAKGTVLTPADIRLRSPGQGLSPQKYEQLLGRQLTRDMELEDFFFHSDISGKKISSGKKYQFGRPWGIPVRFHDIDNFIEQLNPELIEFHLSYSDLDSPFCEQVDRPYNCEFVVHAPELFANSHLMDLTTDDEDYRKQSVAETQRVIDLTRRLKAIFPATKTPLIVANIGGFSMDEPRQGDLSDYYLRLQSSLAELDSEGVEIIPQTMAPFPWHFGGQRFQNLFIDAQSITRWCEKIGLRICLDVSHSRLASTHFGWDFEAFIQEVGPFVAHIHMGDAEGVNGEGLQIGEGQIDFVKLGKLLADHCPSASFIPEIWQGHKDEGRGFVTALDRLEGLL